MAIETGRERSAIASRWQRRIERAQELRNRYRYAAEILDFYIRIAGFQNELYGSLRELLPSEPVDRCRPLKDSEVWELTSRFGTFLGMAGEHGPEKLRNIIRELQSRGSRFWAELLGQAWQNFSAASAQELLAAAFLQPCAEFLLLKALEPKRGPAPGLCPFCGRKPGFAILRPLGDGAARSLGCTFCLNEWEFRRILCAGCGEQTEQKLSVFTAGDNIRVECCDSCRTYIKTIDLTKDGHAEPIVDEMASAPLDLWAQERGYVKLRPNLLGI